MNPIRQNHPIAVLATLPPPVNGNTLATAAVVESLKDAYPVVLHNWSSGRTFAGWAERFDKGFRSLASLLKLVQWRWNGSNCLYTVANSGAGLYYNVLIIMTARMLGYRCALHHNAYSYLHSFDWRMHVINRLLGPSGTHIVLAPKMEARFQELYGGNSQFYMLPNTAIMREIAESPFETQSIADRTFRLGHISNLTLEKGLKHVLDTFEALHRSRDVSLTLAGPLMGRRERALVDALLQRYPQRVEYLGAVYGEDKARFFRNIDVLLFPTEYRVEAQPLVIFEAFAFGKPTIAYGRACIPSMIGTDGGHVVPMDSDFVAEAQRIVESWIDRPQTYKELCGAVRRKAEHLRDESQEKLEGFVRHISRQASRKTPIGAKIE